MPTEVSETPAPVATLEEQLKLSRAAIRHVLDAIADDPRKYWLLGEGTGSWDKLTAAAASLYNKPQDEIKKAFQPDKDKYKRYCDQKETDDRLLEHCRENHIKLSPE